jgi:hypothetical protein
VPTEAKLDKVVTAVLTRVPVVGNVILVEPVVVNVSGLAPLVVKAPAVSIFPPRVIVRPVFATPVPPYWPVIIVPFHIPLDIVPRVVMELAPVHVPLAMLLRVVAAVSCVLDPPLSSVAIKAEPTTFKRLR